MTINFLRQKTNNNKFLGSTECDPRPLKPGVPWQFSD